LIFGVKIGVKIKLTQLFNFIILERLTQKSAVAFFDKRTRKRKTKYIFRVE